MQKQVLKRKLITANITSFKINSQKANLSKDKTEYSSFEETE